MKNLLFPVSCWIFEKYCLLRFGSYGLETLAKSYNYSIMATIMCKFFLFLISLRLIRLSNRTMTLVNKQLKNVNKQLKNVNKVVFVSLPKISISKCETKKLQRTAERWSRTVHAAFAKNSAYVYFSDHVTCQNVSSSSLSFVQY